MRKRQRGSDAFLLEYVIVKSISKSINNFD